MILRNDLLKTISGKRDLTHVICLTFNIDLLFVEHVFLRALKKCGHPTLTIFADAEEVSRTFESQRRWLAGIGHRYRVIPVAMAPGFRFHPKAVLLAGPEEGELLVGSGNLTFGGMRQNEEIWMSFSSAEDGGGAIAQFRDMLKACLLRASAPSGAQREVEEAYDASTHSWAGNMYGPEGIIWQMGEGPPLVEQMSRVVGSRPVDRIIVCSPYYDGDGLALRHLRRAWPSASMELFVQPQHSTLSTAALSEIERAPNLLSMASGRKDQRESFVHGKFYALFSRDEVMLFVGSANCSAAAMGLRRGGRNSEILAYRTLGVTEFNETVLAELAIVADTPSLPSSLKADEGDQVECPVWITESVYANGELTVLFQVGPGVTLTGCHIDDADIVEFDSTIMPSGQLKLEVGSPPHFFRLIGLKNGEAVSSRHHWVDNEFRLSATSRQRKLAQAIEGKVSPTSWSLGSWAEVMRLLGDHLRYEPKAVAGNGQADNARPDVQKIYRPSDFYASDYRLPACCTVNLGGNSHDKVSGLQQLLSRYIGAGTSDEEQDRDDESNLDDDEAVDMPEAVLVKAGKKPRHTQKSKNPTESERKRARRVATKLIDQVLNDKFLQHRSEALLGNDLAIIAVLLVAGLSEGWLSNDIFFSLTYKVWTQLFFDNGMQDPQAAPKGWLEFRVERARRLDAFCEAVGTVPLTAALAMWSFMCPPSSDPKDQARFHMATRMAVARLPWLWNMTRLEEVAEEVHKIASRTRWLDVSTSTAWAEIQTRWDRMLREGIALGRLDQCLAKHDAPEWREVTERGPVAAGTIIWQGRLGFGVTTCDADSRDNGTGTVSVLLLREGKRDANVRQSYILPVRKLITAILKERGILSAQKAEDLIGFIAETEHLLAKTKL